MKKLAAAGLGVALAAATITATPQPAKADTAAWILGGIAVGVLAAHVYHQHYGRGSAHSLHPRSWLHVHWCKSRYRTYNKHTDMFYARPGVQQRCHSPHS